MTDLLSLLADAWREEARLESEIADRRRLLGECRRRIRALREESMTPRPMLDLIEGRGADMPEAAPVIPVSAGNIPADGPALPPVPSHPVVDKDLYPETHDEILTYFLGGRADCPHDREVRGWLADFADRVAAGGGGPLWGRWSEWVIDFQAGLREVSVRAVAKPGRGGAMDVELHGPVSPTGFRSWMGVEAVGEELADVVRRGARHLARLQAFTIADDAGEPEWRSRPIDALGLSAGDLKALSAAFRSAGCSTPTLGMIADERRYFGQQNVRCSAAAWKRAGDAIDALASKKEEPAPAPAEAPAYTWHSYPIEKILARANRQSLGLDLADAELGTAGAIASWLSDGNELEDAEVGDFDKLRTLTDDEVRVLRGCLVEWIGEQGIAEEFPLQWVDPTLTPLKVYRVEFRGKKAPLVPVYLRAASRIAAAEYAERYWPKAATGVAGHDGPIPDGARVEDVPRDSYEDRVAAHRAEREARAAAAAATA